ncbi:MAG: hypothetical protein ABI601_21580 [bacterium]
MLGLLAVAACNSGDPVKNVADAPSVVGTWALQSYNGGTLPYSGSQNANGSVNRVDEGSITLDNGHTYVLEVKIVNTLGSTLTPQNFNEVGSYAGSAAAGVVLKPNDLSGGTNGQNYQQVPATVSGTTLSFAQSGKILTFVKK